MDGSARGGGASGGGRGVGAHEDGDTAGDDAVGLGFGELDRAHHGLFVDLADREGVQVLGGLGGVVGVDQPGGGHLGQGFGDQRHDPLVVPEVEYHGEVRRLGNEQADQRGAPGGAGDVP